MRTRTGLQHDGTGPGFTLLEVLLSVVILGLLLSALVFNFSSLGQSASLDEGVAHLTGLLRFARVQAAATGKMVRVSFSPMGSTFSNSLPVQVTTESDPLKFPGVFTPVLEAGELLRQVDGLLVIREARPVDASGPPATAPVEQGTNAPALKTNLDFLEDGPESVSLAFYPDGASDSAEFVVSSRVESDPRRVSVKWSGFLATVKRAELPSEGSLDGPSTNSTANASLSLQP